MIPETETVKTLTRRDPGWTRWGLLLVMILGLWLRLSYVRLIDTPPFSDMADYETMALNLLEGKGLVMDTPHLTYHAYRPPLYPLFLAGCFRFMGAHPEKVRVVQSFLSVLSVPFVYLLALQIFSRGRPEYPEIQGSDVAELTNTAVGKSRWIAFVAATLFCFEETSIFFVGQLLTETLFIFLLLMWSYWMVRNTSRPGLVSCTFLGILGGCLILLRPVFGPLLVFGVVWFFKKSLKSYDPPPSEWSRFSLLESPYAPPFVILVYSGLVVSAWGFRNLTVLGHFVPVSTNSGVNFYLGHHEDFAYASFGNKEGIRQLLRSRGINDEVTESRVFLLQGLRFIQEHPLKEVRNSFLKLYYLYLAPAGWKSGLLPWKWWSYLESPYRPWPWENNRRKLRFWEIRDEEGRTVLPSYKDWFFREGRLPLVFWGWPMVYLTLAGMILALKRGENTGFLFGVIAVYTLTLLVFFTNARFRVPLLPFLYIFAAYALVELICWKRRSLQATP